jgi:hypothetical protein
MMMIGDHQETIVIHEIIEILEKKNLDNLDMNMAERNNKKIILEIGMFKEIKDIKIPSK